MKQALGFEDAFKGTRVFVTGHTGFTGSWATLWLRRIGAEVIGYAQLPDSSPSLFEAIEVEGEIVSIIGDIRDKEKLAGAFREYKPDFVLHLAAQPLVRRSYRDPLETFSVNALGTAALLEAIREAESIKAVVCVTTDKVYKNKEWQWPYRENDELGGRDPYSASKAAAELVIASYTDCFFPESARHIIGVARGGNIIGGGDWAKDRLIPDFVRSVTGKTALTIRYPDAVRPWQHVLALVQGYLMLLAAIRRDGRNFAHPWNFGPADSAWYSVRDVLDLFSAEWRKPKIEYMEQPLEEARTLALDSSLARRLLGWNPAWDTHTAIIETARWYKAFYENPGSARSITEAQIDGWRARAMETAALA